MFCIEFVETVPLSWRVPCATRIGRSLRKQRGGWCVSLLPPEIAARAPRLGAVRATTPTQDKGTFGHASMRHRRKAGYSGRLHAVRTL